MIREAAEKGIKVIPVASSGVNKSTEFLLKFFAMGTNSTYTFLTNHSGIGGHHIAPEAGSYNVETLNDLQVRLIIENGEYHDCETTASIIPLQSSIFQSPNEYPPLEFQRCRCLHSNLFYVSRTWYQKIALPIASFHKCHTIGKFHH